MKDRESIGVWMTARVVESFLSGAPRWNVARFSDVLHLRDSVTKSVLDPLVEREVLALLAGEEGDIVPARDPAALRVSDVLRAVREAGDDLSREMTDDLFDQVVEWKDRLHQVGVEQADLSFAEFLKRQ